MQDVQSPPSVLVTGSEGTLGDIVVETLRATAGVEVIGTDLICDLAALGRAEDLAGVDTVVHLASLHGRDHMRVFGGDDFLAGQRGRHARRLRRCGPRWGAPRRPGRVDGSLGARAGCRDELGRRDRGRADPYSLTEKVGEDLAGCHAAVDGIVTRSLRFGHLAPSDVDHYGFRLLFGGVDATPQRP